LLIIQVGRFPKCKNTTEEVRDRHVWGKRE